MKVVWIVWGVFSIAFILGFSGLVAFKVWQSNRARKKVLREITISRIEY